MKNITVIFLLCRPVDTQPDAPDRQAAETSPLTEALTLADDQLMKCILSAAPGCRLSS